MAWLSPAYPVGAFSLFGRDRMGGRERRHQGCREPEALADRDDRRRRRVLRCGVLRARAPGAQRTTTRRCTTVAELAAAFAPSQGTASGDDRAGPCLRRGNPRGLALCGARPAGGGLGRSGRVSGRGRRRGAGHGIAVEPALQAFLHAVAANLISAGVRLVPLGQTDGQRRARGVRTGRRRNRRAGSGNTAR